MPMHEENVNVLLFELPITDSRGEALKVLAMISLEEECENHTRGFIYQITPNLHDKDEKPPSNPRKGDHSMKKGRWLNHQPPP